MLLAVGFVIKFIWWIVGAVAVVGLFFAGKVLLRHVRERRELAAERALDLTLRADRQHRWTIAGDSRGVYGSAGAAAMQVVSPSPVMASADDDGLPVTATMAVTAAEFAALAEQKPSGWEWALFTSVLVKRQHEILPRVRDSELGFTSSTTTRVYSGAELAGCLVGVIDEMVSTARQVERFLAAPAFTAAFGAPGSNGDVEAITHVANRLMDYHERFLALSESCRSVSAPSQFDTVIGDCGRLLTRPLEGYRDFIAELVDVIESLPKFLPHAAGDVHLGAIALDIDIDGAARLLKRLRALSR